MINFGFDEEYRLRTGYCRLKTDKGMFYKGGGSKIPPMKEPEVVTKVEDVANEEVKRQKRRSYLAGGKQSTILSGIETQLKERLG